MKECQHVSTIYATDKVSVCRNCFVPIDRVTGLVIPQPKEK